MTSQDIIFQRINIEFHPGNFAWYHLHSQHIYSYFFVFIYLLFIFEIYSFFLFYHNSFVSWLIPPIRIRPLSVAGCIFHCARRYAIWYFNKSSPSFLLFKTSFPFNPKTMVLRSTNQCDRRGKKVYSQLKMCHMSEIILFAKEHK